MSLLDEIVEKLKLMSETERLKVIRKVYELNKVPDLRKDPWEASYDALLRDGADDLTLLIARLRPNQLPPGLLEKLILDKSQGTSQDTDERLSEVSQGA